MSQAQEPAPSVIQAACKLAFYNSSAKQRVASEVITAARKASRQVKAAQLSLQQAAQAAHVPLKDLLILLRGDSCFRLVQQPAGGPAQYGVGLNVANIVSRAKGATSTGILTEELPPPKGYVDGKHPIRPGQPECKQFVKFGQCAYNERCVFNHPGKPSAAQHKQQHVDQQQPPAAAPPAPKVPAPPPKHPAWGGAGVAHAVSGGAAVAAGVSTNSTSTQPSATAGRSAEAAANSHSNSLPSTPGMQADTAHKQVYDQQQQQEPTPRQQQTPALQPQQVPPQSAQALPQQQQRLPPGFAPQQLQSRPCHLMTLRGFCPMGDRCPYDHPARPGASSLATVAAAGQQPVPHISTAATPGATQADAPSPLAAAAEPVTPEALTAPAAPAAEAPTAATAGAGTSNIAGPPAGSSSAAAAALRSWRELLAGPQASQQQNGQQNGPQAAQQQVQEAAPAPEAIAPTAATASAGDDDRLLGWTEGCLPQLRGVPNCPFYMGTGTCHFNERCVYHHPPQAEHPECVMHSKLPVRFNSKNRAPYARLVSHLYRLWDYDSCVEAQLKIWLAKHLLNRNNPECHMFSKSASKPAALSSGRGFWWQSMGPYTCSMGEAGEVLHHTWREQPDPASQQPFPYTKKLRELLSGDPYFSVVVDKDCNSHYWVKLEVDKIKGMLNF